MASLGENKEGGKGGKRVWRESGVRRGERRKSVRGCVKGRKGAEEVRSEGKKLKGNRRRGENNRM